MESKPQKHILLCVAGMTPQIITETLYALTQMQGERVDEIRVITTLGGRSRILESLLNPQTGKFFEFCRDYQINPASIKFDETTIALLRTADGCMLEDIRSGKDNKQAANQICEIVQELTKNPHTRLHASVAGGRKTMGIYLTAAMQLFGRTQDRLSHVLVSEEFETHRDFFYKPPIPRDLEIRDREGNEIKTISTAQAEIYLADIPFIRLRGVISEWLRISGYSYSDFVLRAQEDLDLLDSSHELRLNIKDRTVVVASRSARLTERELFFYLFFAFMRKQKRGEDGFISLDEIDCEDLDTVFRQYTLARGTERGLDDYEWVPRFAFISTLAKQVASSNPKDNEDYKKSLGEAISKINRKLEDAGLPNRYIIDNRGERGAKRYGLNVPPERIIWS